MMTPQKLKDLCLGKAQPVEFTNAELTIVLDVIKRLVRNPNTYYNPDFGANENKLCIDGCVDYKDEFEKEVIKKFFNCYYPGRQIDVK